MKKTLFGGLLVIAGVVFITGIGQEFGVLQEVQQFETRYPEQDNCNWNETGTSVNLKILPDCTLTLQDTTSNHKEIGVERYDVETESEFRDGYKNINLIQFRTNDNHGDYITRSNTSSNQDTQYYSTEFYIPETQTIYIDYRYQELSSPTSSTLELYDVGNSQVRDSFTLQPGSAGNDFEQTGTLVPQNSGTHQLRWILDSNSSNEQRLYQLQAHQNSSELTDVGSGEYKSNIITEDELFIDRIEHVGDDITGVGTQNQKTISVTVNGYKDGDKVAEEELEVGNTVNIVEGRENIYGNQTIDSYNFEAVFVTEDTSTADEPELNYVLFEGGFFERVVNQNLTGLMQQLMLMVFIGLALLYMVGKG